MTLVLARLLVDFGLAVLIWMIQLVVYPSFKYYSKPELQVWHKRYTVNLSLIVMPLMLIQLFIYGVQVVILQSFFSIAGLLLVLSLWAITFVHFVPLHQKIATHQHTDQTLHFLVQKNWTRTLLWNVLFFWSTIDFIM